jgi:hypothetical protein
MVLNRVRFGPGFQEQDFLESMFFADFQVLQR